MKTRRYNVLVLALLGLAFAHPAEAAPPRYQNEVLSRTPWAFYRFNEASGTTATDTSGNGRSGTYAGSPTFGITGAGGSGTDNAVGFNGSTQSMTLDAATLGPKLTNVTVEAVFRTTSSDQMVLFGTLNDGITTAIWFEINRTTPNSHRLFIRSDTGNRDIQATFTNSDLTNGAFHHLMIAVDLSLSLSNRIKIYVNGIKQNVTIGSDSSTAVDSSNSFVNFQYPLAVGARNLRGTIDAHFDGDIDEFAIYDRTLTAEDAAFLAGAALGWSPYQTLVMSKLPYSFHRFNEAEGPTAIDTAGNNRTGTYLNEPTFGIPGAGRDNAVEFDRDAEQAMTFNANTIGSEITNVTFEAVFSTTVTDEMTLFGTVNDGTAMAVLFQINFDSHNSHRLFMRSQLGTGIVEATFTNTALTSGRFNHLMIAVEITHVSLPNNIRIYVNGVEQTVTFADNGFHLGHTINDFGHPLAVGALNNRDTIAAHFNGVIDEFAIYARTLTAEDAAAHTGSVFPSGTMIILR